MLICLLDCLCAFNHSLFSHYTHAHSHSFILTLTLFLYLSLSGTEMSAAANFQSGQALPPSLLSLPCFPAPAPAPALAPPPPPLPPCFPFPPPSFAPPPPPSQLHAYSHVQQYQHQAYQPWHWSHPPPRSFRRPQQRSARPQRGSKPSRPPPQRHNSMKAPSAAVQQAVASHGVECLRELRKLLDTGLRSLHHISVCNAAGEDFAHSYAQLRRARAATLAAFCPAFAPAAFSESLQSRVDSFFRENIVVMRNHYESSLEGALSGLRSCPLGRDFVSSELARCSARAARHCKLTESTKEDFAGRVLSLLGSALSPPSAPPPPPVAPSPPCCFSAPPSGGLRLSLLQLCCCSGCFSPSSPLRRTRV